jgi:hypothetical protein
MGSGQCCCSGLSPQPMRLTGQRPLSLQQGPINAAKTLHIADQLMECCCLGWCIDVVFPVSADPRKGAKPACMRAGCGVHWQAHGPAASKTPITLKHTQAPCVEQRIRTHVGFERSKLIVQTRRWHCVLYRRPSCLLLAKAAW